MKRNAETNKLFYRSFDISERGIVDDDKREIDISFSSEEPVERWFGAEVLLHGEKNIDLKRLRSVGSVIYGHQPQEMKNIIGPIKKVYLDPEKKQARALIGFDDDETGNTALKKVKSKSLKGVSFGYVITKGRRLLQDEEWTDPDSNRTYKGPAIVATRWEPYEITLTPIPADATIGLGREMTRSLDGIDITTNQKMEGKDMDANEVRGIVTEMLKALPKSPTAEELVGRMKELMGEANKPKLNITVEQLQDLTGRAAAVSDDLFKKITTEAMAGKTEAELLRMINDAVIGKTDATDTGSREAENTGGEKGSYKNVAEIPDDVFVRSLK
jgi:hypothetical protein